MKSIIEEIFYGKRANCEDIDFGKAYWKAHSKGCNCFEKLEEALNEEQKELLDALTWATGEQESEAILTFYKEGFKIGFLIAVECLKD